MTASEATTWHAALHRLQCEAQPHALASVVGVAGSTPREPGAKMVITPQAVHDTLGGGHFELQVIEAARALLAAGETTTRLEAFPLGGRSGQCCGGFVHVLIESYAGAEMTVAVFGAGHVGQALVGLMAPLPWQVLWFDSRPDAFAPLETSQPRLTCISSSMERIDASVAALPPGAHVLIMTHDHDEDRRLVDALLTRGEHASLGLIGSTSKWASFRRRLHEAGHSDQVLATVRCPIGIAQAKGKRPYEIALSVMAELLSLKPDPVRADHRGVEASHLRQVFAGDSDSHTP